MLRPCKLISMASGLEFETSTSPNIQISDKKTVTFDEPKISNHTSSSESLKLRCTGVRHRSENKNPRRLYGASRHESFSSFNDLYCQKPGKRRNSCGNDLKFGPKRRRQGGKDFIALPTKFLLGGNINDPLNLSSMEDEEVNRRLNAVTPQSSPLPTPKHRMQVEVLIPPNIRDPLSLNDDNQDLELALSSSNKTGKRKKHKKSRSKSVSEEPASKIPKRDNDADVSTEISSLKASSDISQKSDDKTEKLHSHVRKKSDDKTEKLHLHIRKKSDEKIVDKIVSPVIPQGTLMRNRKKSGGFSRSSGNESGESEKNDCGHLKFKRKNKRRYSSGTSTASTGNTSSHIHFRPKDVNFQYGNYNRYYGYRNPRNEKDPRLKCLKKEWIEGKDVLDIGCNVGHLTLTIAKDLNPRQIIGIDIDGQLVQAAKKNVRHYLSAELMKPHRKEDFPISLLICHGPIVAAAVVPPADKNLKSQFPHNVAFVEGNYVLDSDQLVEKEKQKYDFIVGLSITKWIHVNWGDDGLKRFFKRIYNQLRPGGKFLLEAQAWPSYVNKKKLTKRIYENFLSIKFKPEQFTEYLLSKQIGFSTCEVIDTPYNPSKGFRRPIQLFTKAAASPRDTPDDN